MLLPRSNAASSESYVFPAQEGTPLAALADEERRGTWRLTLVDRRVENTGTLGGWGLRLAKKLGATIRPMASRYPIPRVPRP